jgi:hypothetical protein
MSTLLVAAIVLGAVAAICFLLITVHNKHKREATAKLLNHFSELGTAHHLSFSGQELLRHCVVGLDGLNRKVLVVTNEESHYHSFLIDLNEVKNCTVKKIYGTAKDPSEEPFLVKIVLQLERQGKAPAEIVFYRHFENHIYEAQELEQKAGHWKSILSKLQAPASNPVFNHPENNVA